MSKYIQQPPTFPLLHWSFNAISTTPSLCAREYCMRGEKLCCELCNKNQPERSENIFHFGVHSRRPLMNELKHAKWAEIRVRKK